VGVDVPSLRNFLEILSGLRLKYDSDDADGFSPSCFIVDKPAANTAPELTPTNMNPTSCAAYLKEKAEHL
jgi:hypothetical protein